MLERRPAGMHKASKSAKEDAPDSPDLNGRKCHRCRCGLLFLKGNRERSSKCRTKSLGLNDSTICFEQQSACSRSVLTLAYLPREFVLH